MSSRSITIPVDPETARAYESAPPEEQRKMQALLCLWLRSLATHDYPPLEQIMDEAARKARERGLTPEILDSILGGRE